MAYVSYKFKRSWIRRKVRQYQKNCEKKGKDFLGTALGVIERRLAEDPLSYRSYGPYWWALKEVLMRYGCAPGTYLEEDMAAEYRGADDLETVVAADEFAKYFYGTWFSHNNRFDLETDEKWSDPVEYVLLDPDCDIEAW